MMRERYVVLGLAPVRAGWFSTVARWASTAVVPVEFLRCVSVAELQARLGLGRPVSAVLLDAATPGADRDALAAANDLGIPVIVVDATANRAMADLGPVCVLTPPFSPDELLEMLRVHAVELATVSIDDEATTGPAGSSRGEVIAVLGPGGTGASTVSIALAQGLATQRSVLLADLCRVADQAMLHDARTLVPSVQDVVEAHRSRMPDPADLLAQTFEVDTRGYRLLLGLRRAHHWVGLRSRAVAAAIDQLRDLVDMVVADIDPDLEGEADTGSTDVEERNVLARTAIERARIAVVVGEPSMKGLHATVRLLLHLVEHGVEPTRIVPVFTRSSRSPRARAELTSAFADLVGVSLGTSVGTLLPPLQLRDRDVEPALRDGAPLPSVMARSLARTVLAARQRAPDATVPDPRGVPITPGALATFTAQERPSP